MTDSHADLPPNIHRRRVKRKVISGCSHQEQDVPPILLQLSEICAEHKKYHEMSVATKEGKEARPPCIPDRCLRDLQILRGLLPSIDLLYNPLNRGSDDGFVNDEGTADGTPCVQPNYVSNLCVFYGAVLTCSFCPHALSLFDYGRNGAEILNRVHRLFTFLSSESVIDDTTSRFRKVKDREHDGSNVHFGQLNSISDQIDFTIAEFLNSLSSKNTFQRIIKDLVSLLFDLSFLSFGDFMNKTHSSPMKVEAFDLEISTFIETSRYIHGPKVIEYTLKVPNLRTVLSLQCGVLHVLFSLYVFRYRKLANRPEDYEYDVSDSIEDSIPYHDTSTIWEVQNDSDLRRTLLLSLQEILLNQWLQTESNVQQQTSWTHRSYQLLSLRSKISACDLLTLLLPTLSKSGQLNQSNALILSDLTLLLCKAVRSHLGYLSKNETEVRTMLDATNATLSLRFQSLLRDVVLFPIYPFCAEPSTIVDIRMKTVSHLLDSLPDVSLLVSVDISPHHFELCRIILRTIHSFFHATNFNDARQSRKFCHRLKSLRIKASAHYITAETILSLINITHRSGLGSISRAILILISDDLDAKLILTSLERITSNFLLSKHSMAQVVCTSTLDLSVSSGTEAKSLLNLFSSLFETAFQDAICIIAIQSENCCASPSNDLEQLQRISIASTANIINCLEIGEVFLSHREQFSVYNFFGTFYQALQYAADKCHAVSLWHESQSITNSHFKAIFSLLVSYGFRINHADYDSRSCESRLGRFAFLQSLFKCISSLLQKESLLVVSDNCSTDASRASEIFDFAIETPVVSRISYQHRDTTDDLLSKHCRFCKGYCKSIRSRLGLILEDNKKDDLLLHSKNCLCAFISDVTVPRNVHGKCTPDLLQAVAVSYRFEKDSILFLLEDVIPLNQRCVLLHFFLEIYLNASKEDSQWDNFQTSTLYNCVTDTKVTCHVNMITALLSCLPSYQLLATINRQDTLRSKFNTCYDTDFLRNVDAFYNTIIVNCYRCSIFSRFSSFDPSHRDKLFAKTIDFISTLAEGYWFACSFIYDNSENKAMSEVDVNKRNDIFSDIIVSMSDPLIFFSTYIVNGSLWGRFVDEHTNRTLNRENECDSAFSNNFSQLFHALPFGEDVFDSASVRKSLWRLIRSCIFVLSTSELRALNSCCMSTYGKNSIPVLKWFLLAAFVDSDEHIRRYAANHIGSLLSSCLNKLAAALRCDELNQINAVAHDFYGWDLATDFFSSFDASFMAICFDGKRHPVTSRCGLALELSSSLNSISRESLLQTSILVFSSLCEQRWRDGDKSLFLIEAAVRLIRLHMLSFSGDANSQIDTFSKKHRTIMKDTISSASMEELYIVNIKQKLNTMLSERFEHLVSNRLVTEIIASSANQSSFALEAHYIRLSHFIQTFLLRDSLDCDKADMCDDSETFDAILYYTDSFLPAVVSGFIVDQNYECLLACTGFRLYLARHLTASRKKHGRHFTSEYVIGMCFRRQMDQMKLRYIFSLNDVKRQASLLCVSDKEGLRVLGHVLPRLLLQPSLSPLKFFLETVLNSEVSLGDLLIEKELKIIEELVWELGNNEREEPSEFTSVLSDYDRSWSDEVYDNAAVQALKKGSIILEEHKRRKGEETDFIALLGSVELSGGISAVEVAKATENWVRSHFMMLLVNVVTIKWKRGRLSTKIQAIKCLRVLLRFLVPEDTSQYVTQILTMIDAVMNFTSEWSGDPIALSKLRLLAIITLSHFVRLMSSYHFKVVGDNLCKIVVILFPLLNLRGDYVDETVTIHENGTYNVKATKEAAFLIESLLTGENGPKLAPYFKDVPFLPLHPLLQKARLLLRSYGISFDELLPTTKFQDVDTDCINSDTLGENGESHDVSLVGALRMRLHVIENLVKHENDNVRYIAISHLISVLNQNRNLLQTLIESEETPNRFLSIVQHHSTIEPYDVAGTDDTQRCLLHGGSFVRMMRSLLRRCIDEPKYENRIMLARCLGEIGAIGPSYIGQDFASESLDGYNSQGWRLNNGAPWKSDPVKINYALDLVTKYFVAALKASPTPTDQHKIAFAIQEVLKMIDAEYRSSLHEKVSHIPVNPSMSSWLRDQLSNAKVLDVIEPFWSSQYKQEEASKPREPPFFIVSDSYFSWISSWGRFMIERSYGNGKSPYRDLFFSCRSAIRSIAGLNVIEYLLPLLVLDSVTYGSDSDKKVTVNEITSVLQDCTKTDCKTLNDVELQKCVGSIFSVIDMLAMWRDSDIEEGFRRHKSRFDTGGPKDTNSSWSSGDCIAAIQILSDAIPLSLRARAASIVGMHARSLLYLEMAGRKHKVDEIYNNDVALIEVFHDEEQQDTRHFTVERTQLDTVDLSLMQQLLGKLEDIDSMVALAHFRDRNGLPRDYMDKVNERESCGDWEGVVQTYEQVAQIGHASLLRKSANEQSTKNNLDIIYVRALLELGQLESALHQVKGILTSETGHFVTSRHESGGVDATQLSPYGIEACWRLSRWDLLNHLIDLSSSESDVDKNNVFLQSLSQYKMYQGKALYGIHKLNKDLVNVALEEGRDSVMSALSVVARENYSRAYPYLLMLHCFTEIEDASQFLCSQMVPGSPNRFANLARSAISGGWDWKARLDITGRAADTAFPILNVRLCLARLANSSELESNVWLEIGKIARKGGHSQIAANALAHAQVLYASLGNKNLHASDRIRIDGFHSFSNEVHLQIAKMSYASGQSTVALQMLEDEVFRKLLRSFETENVNVMLAKIASVDKADMISKKALQVTEWIIDGGLSSVSEVINRFRLLQLMTPASEKAHFAFAKYLDTLLQFKTHSKAKQDNIFDDDLPALDALKKDEACQKLLLEAVKEYSESLRLSQKHVFHCLPRLLTLWFEFTAIDGSSELSKNQERVNALLAACVKSIPAISYYTVLPQLISHLSHRDEDTCVIVMSILKRVLTKFPRQAMWALAWLRNSVHPDRQQRGEDIFKGAQKNLQRIEDLKMHDLLVASKSLFIFLINLAKYQPKRQDARHVDVRTWRGEVDLVEFVPPVQAALTLTRNAICGSVKTSEYFPPFIPRMRSFSSHVQVMSSKAKPKKLTAFAVPTGWTSSDQCHIGNSTAKIQSGDIGEMHFLVKQEAKGDLRKDARVQDFNNVVNRLLASSAVRNCSRRRKHRILRIPTFSVVCLSEDCGVIEWVPNTDSIRNIVAEAYNPQASCDSIKRRGKRISNFNDPGLRETFQKCQDLYLKHGNLMGAVRLFDDLCIKQYPPLLYWWFVRKFEDPHKWFEARTLFTLSSAVWSAVGHVIGLGDRHSENLLLDVSNGECVHVDFDCIFNKGLHLPRPEVVPFRLTPNILDAFGPIGADGAFSGSLMTAMLTLRENREILLSVLEPFLKDPIIDWKRHRAQQNGPNGESSGKDAADGVSEAKRSMKVIEGRLNGIYNLRNPNYKKIKRTDGYAPLTVADDDMTHIIPLSVEGQVHKLITEACSHENLVQLYVGWMSWL